MATVRSAMEEADLWRYGDLITSYLNGPILGDLSQAEWDVLFHFYVGDQSPDGAPLWRYDNVTTLVGLIIMHLAGCKRHSGVDALDFSLRLGFGRMQKIHYIVILDTLERAYEEFYYDVNTPYGEAIRNYLARERR